jgi:sulfur-carrier protein adenylyltransferase/sulfurtransferase
MGLLDRLRKALGGGSPEPAPIAPPEPEPEPLEVPEITVDELRTLLANGQQPVLVDVRPSHAFRGAHLTGARNIPLSILPDRLGELDKGAEIVVYCDHGFTSLDGAGYLIQQGYAHARSLVGGITTWQGSGGAVEGAWQGATLK